MMDSPFQRRRFGVWCAAALCPAASRGGGQDAPRLAFVSHAPDSDTWWTTVRNALQHAAADFGVQVDYLNPRDGRVEAMAALVDGIQPERYAAAISTIADFDALRGPLQRVVKDKHLPLITVNSGTTEQSERIGALMHIGQPEYEAGFEAGLQARRMGASRPLCLNHFPNNPASHLRCKGFVAGVGEAGEARQLALEGPPEAMVSAITRALERDPGVDVLLALGPLSAHPALQAFKRAGKAHPPLVSFDLSAPITAAIRSGDIAFAIDQQPYLQGYLAVALLAERLRGPATASMMLTKVAVYANEKLHQRVARYGLSLKANSERHIHSGPGFVTQLNVERVERFSGQFR